MASLFRVLLTCTLCVIATTQALPAYGPGSDDTFGSSFESMKPMVFPSFTQMQSQQQAQKKQSQGQTQGQSAATGEGSADEGQLSSVQNSNTNTTSDGTVSQGGSLGQCQGTNCAVNGATQVGSQGAFQSQKTNAGQNLFGFQGQNAGSSGFPSFGNAFGNQNDALQKQFQSQFQTGGAAIGSGSVDKGTVNSAQNTQSLTDKFGSKVASTNIGQGAGTNLALSGAVQASGQGQTQSQVDQLATNAQNQGLTGAQGDDNMAVGSLSQAGSKAAKSRQKQLQTQGTGAAAGQSSAEEGTAQNLLNSNVDTNAGGTSVSSNAANTATGKHLKVGGSVSASGQGQSQFNNNLALNLLSGSGMMGQPISGNQERSYSPNVVVAAPVIAQPVPVGGY